MTTWNPTTGARISIGWAAIHQLLTDQPDAGWVALKEAARKTPADLTAKTCQNLIADAVRHGYLEKTGIRYHLTAKGRRATTTGATR